MRSGGKWDVKAVCEQDCPSNLAPRPRQSAPYHRPANLTLPKAVAPRVCHIGSRPRGPCAPAAVILPVTVLRGGVRQYRQSLPRPPRSPAQPALERCSGTRGDDSHGPDKCQSSALHKGDAAFSTLRVWGLGLWGLGRRAREGLKRFRKGCQTRPSSGILARPRPSTPIRESHQRRIRFDSIATHACQR